MWLLFVGVGVVVVDVWCVVCGVVVDCCVCVVW